MTGSVVAAVAQAVKLNIPKELVNHVATAFKLIHHDGKAYAVYRGKAVSTNGVPYGPDEPPGIARAFGASLRRYIVGVAWERYSKPVSRTEAENVMTTLESMAFKRPATPLALRFHHDPAHDPAARRVVVDLARADGLCAIVTAAGWTLDHPPAGVVFRRSHATRPLPVPVSGDSTAPFIELAGVLGLDPAGPAFRLMLGWVLGLPFASSVRPGLLLTGEPGIGKTTRIRLLTSLWEPSGIEALGSCFGQNHANDLVRASYRAVPLWDNLSGVSNATSDLVCTLITGSAREVRQLYTTGDLDTTAVQRPVGLTAVGTPAGLRADALDRLVVVDAPAPPYRIDDAEVQRRFDELHPRLLGAALNAVVGVLAQPALWPGDFRMAAYAATLAALDAAGMPGLLDAYASSVLEAKQSNAATDAFGGAVVRMLERHGGQWAGTASALLTAAVVGTPYGEVSGPGWPRSPQGVPVALNHLRGGLAALGVTWTTTKSRGLRRYHVMMQPTEDV